MDELKNEEFNEEGEELLEEDDEEFTVEDIAYEAHNRVDALIQLLQKKGILHESEVDTEVESMLEDDDDEEGDDPDSEEESNN